MILMKKSYNSFLMKYIFKILYDTETVHFPSKYVIPSAMLAPKYTNGCRR